MSAFFIYQVLWFHSVLIVDEVTFDNIWNRFIFESYHKFNVSDYVIHSHMLSDFDSELPFSHLYFYKEQKFEIIHLSFFASLWPFIKTERSYFSITTDTSIRF